MSSQQPPKIEIRRSKRRRRTVSAYRDGETVVILMPASTPRSQEQEIVDEMVQRLDRTDPRQNPVTKLCLNALNSLRVNTCKPLLIRFRFAGLPINNRAGVRALRPIAVFGSRTGCSQCHSLSWTTSSYTNLPTCSSLIILRTLKS